MNNLLAFLNSIIPLSVELQQHLSIILKQKEYKKKSLLLQAGQISKNIFFIEKGLTRCFYLKETTEVCSWFMKEGDVIISVESFFKQLPSYESVQALEDTLVYYIDYEELQYIYRNFLEFNFIARVLTEKYYTLAEQRLFSLRMQKASERYQHILKNFPELIQRVPSTYLASYLGITLETLSRIKAKL